MRTTEPADDPAALRRAAARSMLSLLSDDDYLLLRLRYFERWNLADIAAHLQLAPGEVLSRTRAAMKSARRLYRGLRASHDPL